MKNKHLLLMAIISIFAFFSTNGQDEFKVQDDWLSDTHSTLSMISVDLNQDLTDDLVLFEDGKKVIVKLNNFKNEKWKEIKGPELESFVWSSVAVDFNNDGYKEIVCGTASQEISVYTFNYHTNEFLLYWQAPELFFLQNMNAIDINNDGYLDLYINYDNGENKTFLNDQNEGFDEVKIIDFSTTPNSDMSGNYGSVWDDFNGDGHIDLYLTKCKLGVTDWEDGRRINQLFLNDGNGGFIERGEEYGVNYGDQSWTVDSGDLDGDGDIDMLITNHDSPLIIAENINNTYFVKTLYSGVAEIDNFWQASLIDFNMDGKLDIILTGDEIHLYENHGNFSFQEIYLSMDTMDNVLDGYNFVIGDYDNNGSPDIYLGKAYGFTSPHPEPDQLFLNNTNSDYVRLSLVGTESNRDGVGALIKWYSGLNSYSARVKAGNSYGTMNSLSQLMAAPYEVIDSINIAWPSGNFTQIIDPELNYNYLAFEDGCFIMQDTIEYLSEVISCVGKSETFYITSSANVLWHDNSSNNQNVVKDEEEIFAILTEGDCEIKTPTIYPFYQDTVTQYFDKEVKDGLFPYCAQETVILDPGPGISYLWSDGSSESTMLATDENSYYVTVTKECHQEKWNFDRENQKIYVDWPNNPIITDKSINVPVYVEGDSIIWYADNTTEAVLHYGNTYIIPFLEDNIKLYAEAISSNQLVTEVGRSYNGGIYAFSNINPTTTFTTHQDLYLESITTSTDIAGERKFDIYNEDGIIIYSTTAFLDSSNSNIIFNSLLPKGTYHLASDPVYNQTNFNTTGPYLRRDNYTEEIYPMIDNLSLVSIDKNQFLNNSIYFYFEWKFTTPEKICRTEREEIIVKAIVGEEVINNDLDLKIINPFIDVLGIQSSQNISGNIFNSRGQLVQQLSIINGINEFDTSDFFTGIYILRLENGNSYKILKM